MGDVVPYRSPNAPRERTALLGMIVFLGSWTMMFGALFFGYALLRARAPAWPPPGMPRLPLAVPALNTAIISFSSVALQLALVWTRRGHVRRVAPALAATLVLGAVFLRLQFQVWGDVYAAGLHPSAGPYASVFYGLTWIHAIHVAVGLFALALLAVRAFRGAYTPARHQGLRLWTLYWHYVGVVWALMFVTVYVL